MKTEEKFLVQKSVRRHPDNVGVVILLGQQEDTITSLTENHETFVSVWFTLGSQGLSVRPICRDQENIVPTAIFAEERPR